MIWQMISLRPTLALCPLTLSIFAIERNYEFDVTKYFSEI